MTDPSNQDRGGTSLIIYKYTKFLFFLNLEVIMMSVPNHSYVTVDTLFTFNLFNNVELDPTNVTGVK